MGGLVVFCTVVYDKLESIDRRELWDGIVRLSVTCSDLPWFDLDDFNELRKMSERVNVSRTRWVRLEEFNNCVESSNLTKCEHLWPRSIFCSGQIDRVRVIHRLDRVLCSPRALEYDLNLLPKFLVLAQQITKFYILNFLRSKLAKGFHSDLPTRG